MKHLVYCLIGILLMVSAPSRADNLGSIVVAAETLQPDLNSTQAVAIAWSVKVHSEANGIDWKLLMAVLFQESSLHRDPQGCLQRLKPCKDFGIGQVNWRTWGDHWNLSKQLLLTDYHYSIGTAANILALYRDQFEARDAYWIGRYNASKLAERRRYQERILVHYAKIKAALKNENENGRFRQSSRYALRAYNNPHERPQAVLHARIYHDPLYPLDGPYRGICGALPPSSRNRFKVRATG